MEPQIPRKKLLVALERALVNIVNPVGTDINCAIADTYYHSPSRSSPASVCIVVQRELAQAGCGRLGSYWTPT